MHPRSSLDMQFRSLWGPVLAVQSRGSSMVPICIGFLLSTSHISTSFTPKGSLRPFLNKLPAHKSLFWVLLLKKPGLRQRRAPQHWKLNKKKTVFQKILSENQLWWLLPCHQVTSYLWTSVSSFIKWVK